MSHEIKEKKKKWNKTLIVACFVVIGAGAAVLGGVPSLVCAQAAPITCPDFGLERTTTYNLQDAAYAYGYAVATDDAKNTYVTGEQYAPATGLDMYVIKYDSNGNVVWSDVYDVVTAGVSGNESGYGIAVMPSGSAVYVVGRQQDGASLDSKAFIRKYDSSGSAVVSFGSGGTVVYDPGSQNIARAVALDGSGNIYAVGYQGKTGGGIEAVLLSYDANGTLRTGFPVAYIAAYNASAFGVAVSGTAVYMTGYTQPTATNTDMFVRRYTTGGGSAWAQTYNSSGNQTDIGYGVTVDGSGNIFVTGYHDMNGGDSFLRKYDATGILVWGDSYNSGSNQNDVGRGAIVGNSGRIFVAGRQQTNNEDAFLNEYYTEKNIPILPAANPPPGTEDWTTTQSVYCTDSQSPPEAWEPDTPVTLTPCDTGSHTYMNLPLESCTATSYGKECWYSTWTGQTCQWPTLSTTCNATLVESGFFASLTSAYIYKGDQAGAPEYNEMAFGVAVAPASDPLYTATANDVYVVGYQASNGGEAFLNKYSCNAAQTASSGGSLIANFTTTPLTGPDPLTVNVDARASAGSVTKYEWDWDYAGIPASFIASTAGADKTSITSHVYTAVGTHTIALRVTSALTTSIATRTIIVSANTAPTASFTVCDTRDANCVSSGGPPPPFTGVAPLRVNVDGALSADSDGYVKSFSWNWGDGTVAGIGQKATHLYSTQGTYTITLTVTDNGGLTNVIPATQNVSVVAQYVCAPTCSGVTPVCGPSVPPASGTQCYECLTDASCGAGYECSTANTCTLSGSAVDTECYVEEQGSCSSNADCTESITGGVCDTTTNACRYARCANDTALACTTDTDCAGGDGICYNPPVGAASCVYIYDCAYGPGLVGTVSGLYATSTPDMMPKMPLGVQPDGQACTQPTPDAPNNCEGINGCLYYNYYSATGTAIPNSNNSVANCVNTFEGGTGCVYYQYYDGATQVEKVNCLPRYAENSKKAPNAGIPDGCFVVDKGKAGKEYNCTAVDGCYYYLDGRVDCTYVNVTAEVCVSSTTCTTQPTAIASCNSTTSLCEYKGNGCIYEPNPEGAISCPGATSPATGGDNFVQCLLNPDGQLPGFLNTANSALSSCNVSADCPPDNICLNGTCYPACQANVDCASGEQCTPTCTTSLDCTAGFICDGNVCVPPLCASGTPSGTLLNVTSANLGLTTPTAANCSYSTDSTASYTAMTAFNTTGTTGHSELLTGLIDASYAYYVLCAEVSSSVLTNLCQINFDIATISCTPGTMCTSGLPCSPDGTCPTSVPACAGAFPTGSLPLDTTATTIGLTTAQDAACKYSLVLADPYASMTPFMNTNTTSHDTNVSGLLTGANTYYARCQDVVSGTITNACQISFGVGATCTDSSMCSSGYECIAGICQPPVCDNADPTGSLAMGTTSTTISLTTNTDSNCRYSTSSADPYGAMTSFGASGTSHSAVVSGLVTGGNTHYVRCQDAVTSAEKFCQIPFSVGVCSQQFKCDTGFMCIPNTGTGFCSPPVCPYGTWYDATFGCVNCATHPAPLPPECTDFCVLNPFLPECCVGPLCTLPGGGPGPGALPGEASCNTLGYTFTNTAITASGNCSLVALLLALLSWLAWFVALLVVLSGLRAAYLYITSMGDQRKLILARSYLIYTTIGVGVAVLTFSIVAITRAILNI
ncbi:MAG: PKD domain-containing protein [Candidatus Azambacteria bacterium]|nr:PKD domain-containing protein [Candidatus Azambacteria bacterium]